MRHITAYDQGKQGVYTRESGPEPHPCAPLEGRSFWVVQVGKPAIRGVG